jgi:hypothetical protein
MNTTAIVAASDLSIGNVVTVRGNARRFVVVSVGSTYNLRAISGGARGCGPSSMPRAALTLDADQSVVFSGVEANKRRQDALGALAMVEIATKTGGLVARVTAGWR